MTWEPSSTAAPQTVPDRLGDPGVYWTIENRATIAKIDAALDALGRKEN